MSARDLVVEEEEVIDLPEQPPERTKRRKQWSFPEPGEPRETKAPLTEEQWARVLRGKKRTVVKLVTLEQREWAGSNASSCGTCKGTKLHGDPRRGWCIPQKMMTGITFPVLCRTHEFSEGGPPQ